MTLSLEVATRPRLSTDKGVGTACSPSKHPKLGGFGAATGAAARGRPPITHCQASPDRTQSCGCLPATRKSLSGHLPCPPPERACRDPAASLQPVSDSSSPDQLPLLCSSAVVDLSSVAAAGNTRNHCLSWRVLDPGKLLSFPSPALTALCNEHRRVTTAARPHGSGSIPLGVSGLREVDKGPFPVPRPGLGPPFRPFTVIRCRCIRRSHAVITAVNVIMRANFEDIQDLMPLTSDLSLSRPSS